jgi:hypothetical protein
VAWSFFAPASARGGVLTPADQFAILGIGGSSAASRGTVIINSATSITGDVGYARFTTSTTNQKVTTFTGTAYVHSEVAPTATTGTNWNYTAATYVPSGGIQYGSSSAAVDTLLDDARAAALAASTFYGGLPATLAPIASINDTSATITSTGAVNVIDIGAIDIKSDTITLSGRVGFTDTFIIRVTGNFAVDQSTIALANTTAAHVLWYFPTAATDIDIVKAETIFNGTILAPFTTSSKPVIYHNPATFNGAIIARDINVHSDFNITHVAFVPEPATGALLVGFGLAALACARRRRRR